MLIPQLISCVR